MTYDLTNLRKALSYVEFENGCLDCVYSWAYDRKYDHQFRQFRGPNAAEVYGMIRELQLLGINLAEVDGRCHTSLAHGHVSVCITPKRFCEAVEDLLRAKES